MLNPLKKTSIFFAILITTKIAISSSTLTLNGPELTQNISGFASSGLEITVKQNVTLDSFIFENQGFPDTIWLKNSVGDVLQTYFYQGGDNFHKVNISWKLIAGQTYFLMSQEQSNGKWNSYSSFPAMNDHIQVNGTHTFGELQTDFWFNFNDLTTTTNEIVNSDPDTDDTDNDGIPNFVEIDEETDLNLKDNDVFNNSRLFIMQVYRDFLNREGDDGGIDNWVIALDSGTLTPTEVIENFFNSTEFSGIVAPVTRLYFAYFSRIPDFDGLLHNVRLLQEGVSLAVLSEAFAQSQEFINSYGDLNNEDFVTTVYWNVLERDPDPEGFQNWVDKLDQNEITRGSLMVGFSESAEFQTSSFNSTFVTMMYVSMLRRSPELLGFNFWKEEMDLGAPGQELIGDFFDSQEYYNRFLTAPLNTAL